MVSGKAAQGRSPLPETDFFIRYDQSMDAAGARLEMQNSQAHQKKEATMYDIFTAILLADHLSRRHFEQQRRPGPQTEVESPWTRVFAWHRRGTNARL